MTRLDLEQRKLVSKILVDLGKLFFAAAVIGFFIPVTAAKVETSSFVVGLTTSLILFIGGVIIIKQSS